MCRFHRIIMAAVFALVASACAQKAPEAPAEPAAPAVDLAAEEQAVRARSAEWLRLVQARDAAGIMATIPTADPMTMFDGEVRKGMAEIQAGLEQDIADAKNAVINWTTDEVHVAASGDMAYELGTTTADPDGDGKEPATTSKYVTVWRKVDGQWRAAVDAGTEIKPAEAASTSGG